MNGLPLQKRSIKKYIHLVVLSVCIVLLGTIVWLSAFLYRAESYPNYGPLSNMYETLCRIRRGDLTIRSADLSSMQTCQYGKTNDYGKGCQAHTDCQGQCIGPTGAGTGYFLPAHCSMYRHGLVDNPIGGIQKP